MTHELDWDENLDDREFDDDDDNDDDTDDDPQFEPCPACGELVYDDSEQCPYCGEFITWPTSPWSGRSPAWILLGLLGIAAVIYTFLAF